MLIIRTPFRVSFFGGGTDYKDYYEQYGGRVLSTTIDKYCYVSVKHLPPFFDFTNQFTYSRIERFNEPDEVEHPLVRQALKFIPVERVQISYDADLSACSGIGSSSAFAVGLVHALHAMRGEYPDKMTMAKEAIYIERELCGEAGGVQDQLASALGGFNRIELSADEFRVSPLELSRERMMQFQNNLVLMFTGFTHFSGAVAREQQQNIPATLSQLHRMKEMTFEAEHILREGDIDDVGLLLDESWRLKRSLSAAISNSTIDELYARAKTYGALGGKLLGAGGGGFMLLYVPIRQQEKLRRAFPEFLFVPFAFEKTGTKILYENDTM